jgi:hypothetical protein
MEKKRKKRSHRKNNGNSIFVGELTIRDVRFDRIFEVHDRELGAALKDLERFLNDKLQAGTKITMLPVNECRESKNRREVMWVNENGI